MNELIKITEKDGQQLVSARELHEFLEVGRDFTTWIKARIEKYEFLENVDFTIIESFHQNGGKGGRPEKDYVLTIEMAKELSMVENSEKGKQARKYFINCEKKLKEVVQTKPSYMIEDPIERAKVWITEQEKLQAEQEKVKQLGEENKANKPKVIFADAVAGSDDSILVGDLSKLLNQNGIDIGQNRLFEWLRKNNYLISRKGTSYNKPTQKSMDLGVFECKERTIIGANGKAKVGYTPLVTGKGQQYFINKFLNNKEEQ